MNQPFDVVAYVYRSAMWHPECIVAELGRHGEVPPEALAPCAGPGTLPLAIIDPAEALRIIAERYGIDHLTETSYDSDVFPKVVFADQLDPDGEWCGCGDRLNGSTTCVTSRGAITGDIVCQVPGPDCDCLIRAVAR